MRNLRILFALHGYKPAYRVGGPIVSVSATAERLVCRGHRVTVYTTNSNLDEDLDVPIGQPVLVDGVEVWYFEHREPIKKYLPFVSYLSQSMGFLYARDLWSRLSQNIEGFDLVHTHMPYVYPSMASGWWAIQAGKPLFYHQRGVFDPERLKYRGLKKRLYIAAIERPVMRRATTLIALTDAEVSSYRSLGVQTKCSVIPNGIDVGLYRRASRARQISSLSVKPEHV